MKIFKGFLVLLFSSLIVSSVLGKEAKPTKPKVVEEAIYAIDLCNHWGGEDAYDEERGKEISEGVKRDCPEAQKKTTNALKLYPNDPELAEAVIGFNGNGNFDLTDEEKKKVCQTAIPVFKHYQGVDANQISWFRSQCPEQASALDGK